MCFSAGASFGASFILGTIGIITITKVKKPTQVPFASIPLIFSVQQSAEGLLWLVLSDSAHDSWRYYPIFIFLFFAQILWPTWIPWSVLLLEKNEVRRKILKVLLVFGIFLSAYLLYCMVAFGIDAELSKGHIRYILDFPEEFVLLSGSIYFVSTVIVHFVSSLRSMKVLGLSILMSLVISYFYFEDHLISIWCFFAAILSVVILWIVQDINRDKSFGEVKQVF